MGDSIRLLQLMETAVGRGACGIPRWFGWDRHQKYHGCRR